MTLTIHREPQLPKLIRMGQRSEVIEPEPVTIAAASTEQKISEPPPVVELKKVQGRKKMADKKLSDETGVKKISEEDAGTQGAVGSGGVNAPAQEKVPETPKSDSDKGDI